MKPESKAIRSIPISRVPLDSLYRIVKWAVDYAKYTPIIQEKLSNELQDLAEKARLLGIKMQLQPDSWESKDFLETDRKQDKAYRKLNILIQAYEFHPDEAKARSAKALIKLRKDHGFKTNSILSRQYDNMKDYVHLLSTTYCDPVRELGATSLTEQLANINTRINELLNRRKEQESQLCSEGARFTRKMVEESYLHYVQVLNAHSTLEGPALYYQYIRWINKTIEAELPFIKNVPTHSSQSASKPIFTPIVKNKEDR